MARPSLVLIGLALLAGCSGGGGGDPSTTSSAPSPPPSTPTAQPDMLVATSDGLWRGKATGKGGLIFARPNLNRDDLFMSQGIVYYPREAPPILFDYPNQDIWSVRADGTGDHAVLNTTADEFVKDAQGNIAVYEQGTYTLANGLDHTDYGSLRDGAPLTVLPINERFTGYAFMVGTKAFFNNERQIFSVNADGSGLSTHATVSGPFTLAPSDSFDNTLIYREYDFGTGHGTLKAVPVSGGSPASLDDGQAYVAYAGHVGSRVAYQRCEIDMGDIPPRAGACDVVSVNSDGSGTAVLASHPANEAVQGIIGNQVIIRRNLSSNDHLIAVPVAGGAEKLLMTMTDNEFVDLVAGDVLILRRPSGTWSLDMNGTLKQLGSVAGESGFIEVGNAVCLNKNTAVWCIPLDGKGEAVKIAETGKVVGAL